jgi:hypothetical protein
MPQPPSALSPAELAALVRRAFCLTPADRALALLVDLPDARSPDTPAWRWRRELAREWLGMLQGQRAALGLEPALFLYRNVGRANAELPPTAWRHDGGELPARAEEAGHLEELPLEAVLRTHQLVLAPTQFSATAPLKNAARAIPFRGATMPGFSAAMLPALRLDQDEVNRRVGLLARELDLAQGADLAFRVEGAGGHALHLDLRHRPGHASGGVFPRSGVVGNLPSGEAYIVPYEGERAGDPSRSQGELPVQLGDEVVVYQVAGNRAVQVLSQGPESRREEALIRAEPAYANLAELGLGVLAGFGVEPCGDLLLDEKLGVHVAFGRSDHFGGAVGPRDFSNQQAVVHLDRVYVPAIQPRVAVERAQLVREDGARVVLVAKGRWVFDFGGSPGGAG